jgi:hypothetical protein
MTSSFPLPLVLSLQFAAGERMRPPSATPSYPCPLLARASERGGSCMLGRRPLGWSAGALLFFSATTLPLHRFRPPSRVPSLTLLARLFSSPLFLIPRVCIVVVRRRCVVALPPLCASASPHVNTSEVPTLDAVNCFHERLCCAGQSHIVTNVTFRNCSAVTNGVATNPKSTMFVLLTHRYVLTRPGAAPLRRRGLPRLGGSLRALILIYQPLSPSV